MLVSQCLLWFIFISIVLTDFYDENLRVSQLDDGMVLLTFEFELSTEALDENVEGYHFRIFPRDIGLLLKKFDLSSFSLTLTNGRWDHENWYRSYPYASSDKNPLRMSSSGVQVWASFNSNDGKNDSVINSSWKKLVHTLSGMYCASLNYIDSKRTAVPLLFPSIDNLPSSVVRFGSLPREAVCIENLTPWMKLLPCKWNSGLGSILKGHRLFDSNYYQMSVNAKKICSDAECSVISGIQLFQSVMVVFDPIRLKTSYTPKNGWNLFRLLDRDLSKTCPLASETRISLEWPSDKELKVQPESSFVKKNDRQYQYNEITRVFTSNNFSSSLANISVETTTYSKKKKYNPVKIQRYLTGYGDERGAVQVEIQNLSSDDLQMVYYDLFPWFMRIYFHKIVFLINDDEVYDWNNLSSIMMGIDRQRPFVIEMKFNLRPKSSALITIPYDKTLLRYSEYPPDANRGHDLGGGSFYVKSKTSGYSFRVYTNNVILPLPVPDFSMPYNVITLSSTVIALFIGSLFNLLTRSYVGHTKEDNLALKILKKLKLWKQ